MKHNRITKSILAILLSVIIIFGIIPINSISTYAAISGIEKRIEKARSTFPNKKYWNHYTNSNHNSKGVYGSCVNEKCNNPSGVTNHPCSNASSTAHAPSSGVGEYSCNHFDGAIQCLGFAKRIFYEIFEVNVGSKDSGRCFDINNVKIGDFIKIKNKTHYAVVISRNGNKITIVEANHNNACQINWDRELTVSDIDWYKHAKNYDSINHTCEFNKICYETAHPHKKYLLCECGEKSYTKETKIVKTCTKCQPNLTVKATDELCKTSFEWTDTETAEKYNLTVLDSKSKSVYSNSNLKNTSISFKLKPGTYSAYVTAEKGKFGKNYYVFILSPKIKFTVKKHSSDYSNHKVSNTKKYVKSKATCNKDAVYYQTCSLCNKKLKTTWTDKNSHTKVSHSGGTATCIKKAKCRICKKEYGSFKAHSYKPYSTTKATLTKNGKVKYKCKTCGESKSSAIYSPKTFKLSATTYTYNGKVKKPPLTIKDSKGKLISSNCYTVVYSSGQKNVGTYKVTIKFKKNYSGSKSLSFKIIPPSTAISNVIQYAKGFLIKWRKANQVNGYEICYSYFPNFKNAKTVVIKNPNTASHTIFNLSTDKTYYVKIRTYKNVGKTKFYSAWSENKSISIKDCIINTNNFGKLVEKWNTYYSYGICCNLKDSTDFMFNHLTAHQQDWVFKVLECTCCHTIKEAMNHTSFYLLDTVSSSSEALMQYKNKTYALVGARGISSAETENITVKNAGKDKYYIYTDYYADWDCERAYTAKFTVIKTNGYYVISNFSIL